MEPDALHDLTAAYALDALDERDEQEYEAHLSRCERCRRELASLRDAAGSLAYAVEAPAPPPTLRERILAEARAERTNVVPLAPRRLFTASRAVAAVAACAAVGFALWGVSQSRQLDRERAAEARAFEVFADPGTKPVALSGAHGTLYVAPSGRAALVVARLRPAPAGQTYQAWVVWGGEPRSAGVFAAGRDPTVYLLKQPVPSGAVFAVTLEPHGGSRSPTGTKVFTAQV
jgi:anti-sigma-K factor RskA